MYFQKRRKKSQYCYVRYSRCTRTRIDPVFSQTVREMVCLLFNFDLKIWVCSWAVNHALVIKLTCFRWIEQILNLNFGRFNPISAYFVPETTIFCQKSCIGTFLPHTCIWQIEKVHVPSTWSRNYKVQLLRTFLTEKKWKPGTFCIYVW